MNTKIFIPEKIKVGFQKRQDTYTGLLGYVIYYDQKGHLRKETSWNGWCNSELGSHDFVNEPTSGFVLNKKVGDVRTDWSHRKAHIRIYDPRDFEFEISVENLLYILENTNSIRGKGLEGNFIFGWQDKELILIPVDSPDYKEIKSFSDMLTKPESVKGKDLVLGGTYRTNKGEDWIYLGRFERYSDSWKSKGELEGLHYYFWHTSGTYYPYNKFETLKSLSGRIVKTVSTEPVLNYVELMEELEVQTFYSPIIKTEYVEHDLEYLEKRLQTHGRFDAFIEFENKMMDVTCNRYSSDMLLRFDHSYRGSYYYFRQKNHDQYSWDNFKYSIDKKYTLEEAHNLLHFKKQQRYLKNGKLLPADAK